LSADEINATSGIRTRPGKITSAVERIGFLSTEVSESTERETNTRLSQAAFSEVSHSAVPELASPVLLASAGALLGLRRHAVQARNCSGRQFANSEEVAS
jgi:hypothetical protein